MTRRNAALIAAGLMLTTVAGPTVCRQANCVATASRRSKLQRGQSLLRRWKNSDEAEGQNTVVNRASRALTYPRTGRKDRHLGNPG
jgi:hypothetical protein